MEGSRSKTLINKLLTFLIPFIFIIGGYIYYEGGIDMIRRTTPAILLITSLIALYSTEIPIDDLKRVVRVLIAGGVLTYCIEVIGVATGFPFGIYNYGETLGIKLLDVPLVIPFNWVILSFASYLLAGYFVLGRSRIVVATVLLLIFDIILEKAAPLTGQWEFSGGHPPLSNYISWIIIGGILNLFLHITLKGTLYDRKAMSVLYLSQLLFLLIVILVG